MRWTVYVGLDCGCQRGPYTPITGDEKDRWKSMQGENEFCAKHDMYTRVAWIRAGAA